MNAVDFRKKQMSNPRMATNRNMVKTNKPSTIINKDVSLGCNRSAISLDDVLYKDFTHRKNKNSALMKFDNINDVIDNIDDNIDKKAKKKNNKILTTFLKQEARKINLSDY